MGQRNSLCSRFSQDSQIKSRTLIEIKLWKKKQKTISSNLKEGTKNAHPHCATSPGLTTVILEQADPC